MSVLEAANGSLMTTNSRLEKELDEAKAEIEQLKHENLALQTRVDNDVLRMAELKAKLETTKRMLLSQVRTICDQIAEIERLNLLTEHQ